MRYQANGTKLCVAMYRSNQRTQIHALMNENTKLAPDRAANTLGVDNNTEYRLQGRFTGGKVYEPASNRFYPEFVLTGYSVISTAPPMIFTDQRSLDPAVRLLTPPR